MKTLVSKIKLRVRFSEVDSMGIAWHGSYVKYLEDGREAFGREYNLGYMDVYKKGFFTPIVKLDLDYKLPLRYEESAIIETKYINSDAAKIIFEYRILSLDNKLLAKAKTIQVFVNLSGKLELSTPDFFVDWKIKNKLI